MITINYPSLADLLDTLWRYHDYADPPIWLTDQIQAHDPNHHLCYIQTEHHATGAKLPISRVWRIRDWELAKAKWDKEKREGEERITSYNIATENIKLCCDMVQVKFKGALDPTIVEGLVTDFYLKCNTEGLRHMGVNLESIVWPEEKHTPKDIIKL